ncbi:hypothetical protein LOC68_12880 [Blastopirellula sp. JC732]|uniref:SMI1/KNR4 family protein n=1 Tax=Blastopirellula sediminis TaxID=2894196 RepID=A0A9X1SH11_9BACT|nr:hypothetical protein [Blastopirellula sediminis]MCC9607416.1 hypothetical protein [Blastopirellula sediminis]MCC9629291.1 hypothetical protein [Blastopirellula sediminis]
MTSIAATLAPLFQQTPPEDLVRYFQHVEAGDFSDHFECQVNLFPVETAVRVTQEFRDFEPRVGNLQGIVLDDANLSDCHVYLTHPACCGMVMFLRHDGDSHMIFASVDEFLAAANHAIAAAQPLRSYERSPILLPDDEAANQRIREMLAGETEYDIEGAIDTLLASMNLTDLELLSSLASNEDFFIAESVGVAIARRPRAELLPIAKLVSGHPDSQAANAGAIAIRAIHSCQ